MTETAPRRRGVLVGLGVLGVVLALIVVGFVQAPKASKDGARSTVAAYIEDLKSGRYTDATGLLCPALASSLGVNGLQSAYELELKQLGGELISGSVSDAKEARSFRFDWPPTEAHVVVTYLMTYKKGARLHHVEVRDTSDGLRICAFGVQS